MSQLVTKGKNGFFHPFIAIEKNSSSTKLGKFLCSVSCYVDYVSFSKGNVIL